MKRKLLDNHLYIDFKGAIKEEADLLMKNKSFKVENLDWSKFNPMKPNTCFFGQGFGQSMHGDKPSKGDALTYKHREKFGTIAVDGKDWGNMTPLETWAALNWRSNKSQVKAVFDYIAGKRKTFPKIDVGVWNFKLVND